MGREPEVREGPVSVPTRRPRSAVLVRFTAAERLLESAREILGVTPAALALECEREQLIQCSFALACVELAVQSRGDTEAERRHGDSESGQSPVCGTPHGRQVRSRRTPRPAAVPFGRAFEWPPPSAIPWGHPAFSRKVIERPGGEGDGEERGGPTKRPGRGDSGLVRVTRLAHMLAENTRLKENDDRAAKDA